MNGHPSVRRASPNAGVEEVSRVRNHPLYKQAEQLCQEKQFKQAADRLTQLVAVPGFSAQEIAFCNRQRDICRKDAGLPPLSPPSSASTPAKPPHNDTDCGPRALAFVLQSLGKTANLERLRTLAGTDATGTTLEGLKRAAQGMGMKAEGVQVSREALSELDAPAVAWVHGNHYVAVLSVAGSGKGATARVHDPNSSDEETIPQERLLSMSNGFLLLVRR